MTFEKKMPTMDGSGSNGVKQGTSKADKMEKSKLEEVKQEDTISRKDGVKTGDEGEKEKTANKQGNEDVLTKMSELQKQNEELERKLIYIASEYENSKRRSAKDLEDTRKFAISKFAKDVVGLFDILQRAMENVDPKNTDKVLCDGVKMTMAEFERAFESMQIKKIEPEVGSVFDHNKQEAISRVSSELEAGSIVQVIRCGYELYDRLLRPAMVVVSGGK